ncbi:hypothetical protein [Hydrogenophaga sp.]|uniref:hypothetical protein n=1 Tax=Hydrogenophaga sp. TaxID=1904254 RepID=UPI00271A7871|nr:hypothetical protein [Hydrogenophaga sp.]MDO8903951.1 hypothetical protein [Hydrogenophaga sp.]
MKRFRIILAAAAAFALSGCASIPGGSEIAAVATSAVDALTGPDTDYKNYLTHCRAEINAQRLAIEADSKALQAGLSSSDEKIQFGSLILLAAKSGMSGPRVGCSVERKRGFTELMFQNSNLLDFGLRLYEVNRADHRFKRQLDADKEMSRDRMDFQRDMEERRNRLITTLTGDELELRESQQDYELERRRLDQQAPPPMQ